MISLEDCIGLCDLTPEEIAAIAEHEHMPEIVAASLGNYLVHSEHGAEKIRDMIIDDIRTAVRHRDVAHAKQLVGVLRHFLVEHPGLSLRP